MSSVPAFSLSIPSMSSSFSELMAERERVEAWRNWRMSDYDTLANGISVMRFEEEFSLNWLGTNSIDQATTLPFINEVFTHKLVEKLAKGKDKVPEQQIQNPADEERTRQKELKESLILSADEESNNISLNPQSETPLVNNPRSELETDDILTRVLTTLNDVMNRMKSLEENQIELGKHQKLIKADTKKIPEIEDKVNAIYDLQLQMNKDHSDAKKGNKDLFSEQTLRFSEPGFSGPSRSRPVRPMYRAGTGLFGGPLN